MVVILASAVSIFLTQRRPKMPINLLPFEGCGVVGAAEVSKLLNGQGRLLVVTYKDMRPLQVASRAFAKELTKHPGLRIVATEALLYSRSVEGEEFVVKFDQYLDWLKRYPDVDAIVSFVGAPRLTAEDWRRLPRKRPGFVVLEGFDPYVRQLLVEGFIDLAVVPRYGGNGNQEGKQTEPKTATEWFTRYYMFATPQTVEQLPAF